MEETLKFTESELLWCISANSNGFIRVYWNTNEVKVGKRMYGVDEFLEKWLENGERAFNGLAVRRMR